MAYSISTNQESYDGTYQTRDEAVAEAINRGQEMDIPRVWVGEIVSPTQPELWWEAEQWLEHVSCQDEYNGDWASDWDESTKAQRVELEDAVRKVMAEWLDRHKLRPSFFNIGNSEEIPVPQSV